jgi:hypothetical protein
MPVLRNTRCVVAILTLSLLGGAQSLAQFSVDVNTYSQVGLDEPTRNLINNFMPKEVKEQTLDLLYKALPLLKENFDEYLKEIDELMARQVTNAQCGAVGFTQEFMAQFKTLSTDTEPMSSFREYEAKNCKA